jgi:hypothetical protein
LNANADVRASDPASEGAGTKSSLLQIHSAGVSAHTRH